MTSNHRLAPSSGRRTGGPPSSGAVEEKLLRSERFQIERKTYTLSLRENPRGRFLRITEDVSGSGRHNTVIVPAPGLDEFVRVLTDMARTNAETPYEGPTVPPPESPPSTASGDAA